MTVGDRIRRKRELIGISQTAFAEMVNISKQTLYKYETNIITNIPSNKIEEIAKALNVSPAYLMGWEDNLNAKNADIMTDILTNARLIEYAKKITLLNPDHQSTIFNMVDYWYEKEKEGH
ncbi:MAG: helix-turn-helix domain-containing protein [Lachnospiraceae bacterium]